MTNPKNLVSCAWLADNLGNPAVVIVDCRFALADPLLGQKQYKSGHIPGAFFLDLNTDLSSPVGKHGGRHPLPNIDQLAEKLGSLGIKFGETLVVAYDQSKFGFASRLWWLLKYMGHEQVVLLDGGFIEWQKNYAISETIPQAKPAIFTPQICSEMVVDIETVKAKKDLPGVVLVDSREGDRYLGKIEPIDPIAGHIPGAVNYPWQEVTDDASIAKISEQKSRWSQVAKAEEIIVYCGSGVTACVNLWSLEMAGITGAKLYAGSWSDWCSYLV